MFSFLSKNQHLMKLLSVTGVPSIFHVIKGEVRPCHNAGGHTVKSLYQFVQKKQWQNIQPIYKFQREQPETALEVKAEKKGGKVALGVAVAAIVVFTCCSYIQLTSYWKASKPQKEVKGSSDKKPGENRANVEEVSKLDVNQNVITEHIKGGSENHKKKPKDQIQAEDSESESERIYAESDVEVESPSGKIRIQKVRKRGNQ
jgi:hypothetical protein